MSIQYISDSNGNPTGVFIPLNEWEKLKEQYSDIEQKINETNVASLTQEQKNAIDEGLLELELGKGISHNDVMDEARMRYPELYISKR